MKVIEGSQCLALSQSFLDIERIIYRQMIMSTVRGSILGQLITLIWTVSTDIRSLIHTKSNGFAPIRIDWIIGSMVDFFFYKKRLNLLAWINGYGWGMRLTSFFISGATDMDYSIPVPWSIGAQGGSIFLLMLRWCFSCLKRLVTEGISICLNFFFPSNWVTVNFHMLVICMKYHWISGQFYVTLKV